MIYYLSSLVSGDIATPNNALGAPDGAFTTNIDNEDWEATYLFDAHAELDGEQTITLRVRKQEGTGNPTLNMYIQEDGQNTAQLPSAVVTSLTGEDIVANFTPIDPNAQIGIYMTCSAVGGSPNARASVQIDAITWDAVEFVFLGSTINTWQGSWVAGKLKYWDGAEWLGARVQRWNGSGWENVP